MLRGIEVTGPQAEADRRFGAALGADHAGCPAARALAERARLEQDDAFEALRTKEPGAPRADGPPTDHDGVSGTGDLKAVHLADARID